MHTPSQRLPHARRALLRQHLSSALAIGLTCSALGAQADPVDDTQAADATRLDTIVVTGLATGRSQKDAPLAISVLPETLIDRWPPAANVEILRSIPGFSVESSGEHVSVQIVKRSELHTFKVMPKRWIDERSFAWLEKNRRL